MTHMLTNSGILIAGNIDPPSSPIQLFKDTSLTCKSSMNLLRYRDWEDYCVHPQRCWTPAKNLHRARFVHDKMYGGIVLMAWYRWQYLNEHAAPQPLISCPESVLFIQRPAYWGICEILYICRGGIIGTASSFARNSCRIFVLFLYHVHFERLAEFNPKCFSKLVMRCQILLKFVLWKKSIMYAFKYLSSFTKKSCRKTNAAISIYHIMFKDTEKNKNHFGL